MTIKALVAVGLACAVAGGTLAAGASGAPAAKTYSVKLSGITFGGKKNLTMKAKVGDTIRFVWAGGGHNVESSKLPSGVTRTESKVVSSRPPLLVKLAKKGVYKYHCDPHESLGMTATITVT
jgi:plastocyanin